MNNNLVQLEYDESKFPSKVFPGHYYEAIDILGEGGIGTVYAVLLRNLKTKQVT